MNTQEQFAQGYLEMIHPCERQELIESLSEVPKTTLNVQKSTETQIPEEEKEEKEVKEDEEQPPKTVSVIKEKTFDIEAFIEFSEKYPHILMN